MANKYFVLIFVKKKIVEDSEISVVSANMLRDFKIKKEVVRSH